MYCKIDLEIYPRISSKSIPPSRSVRFREGGTTMSPGSGNLIAAALQPVPSNPGKELGAA